MHISGIFGLTHVALTRSLAPSCQRRSIPCGAGTESPVSALNTSPMCHVETHDSPKNRFQTKGGAFDECCELCANYRVKKPHRDRNYSPRDIYLHISKDLADSKWITRGWTLQELIAPDEVVFFTSEWTCMGNKRDLQSAVSRGSGIPEDRLTANLALTCSIYQKMSFARNRKTTREEDQAYCLLGLFGITMPLLYGEGENAFGRLQIAIIDATHDPSFLAWKGPRFSHPKSCLAPSPDYYSRPDPVNSLYTPDPRAYSLPTSVCICLYPSSKEKKRACFTASLARSPKVRESLTLPSNYALD